MSQLNIYTQLFASQHHYIFSEKKPWHTSVVMSPAEPSLLYTTKRGGPKQGKEGGCYWSASRDRLTGKLLPGCLADTRWSHQGTSLTNEGPCLVHWHNLSTSWTYGNKINLKFSWIKGRVLNKRLEEIKGNEIVELHVTSIWSVLILIGFELFIKVIEMFTPLE